VKKVIVGDAEDFLLRQEAVTRGNEKLCNFHNLPKSRRAEAWYSYELSLDMIGREDVLPVYLGRMSQAMFDLYLRKWGTVGSFLSFLDLLNITEEQLNK